MRTRTRTYSGPDADGSRTRRNIRNRILSPALEIATNQLIERERSPLPHLTPHGCRHTFASVLYALHRREEPG